MLQVDAQEIWLKKDDRERKRKWKTKNKWQRHWKSGKQNAERKTHLRRITNKNENGNTLDIYDYNAQIPFIHNPFAFVFVTVFVIFFIYFFILVRI